MHLPFTGLSQARQSSNVVPCVSTIGLNDCTNLKRTEPRCLRMAPCGTAAEELGVIAADSVALID